VKPCLICGRLSEGSRCPAHELRGSSTRAWRRVRAQVLARDHHRCQFCGQAAVEVDHIVRLADGGTDHPDGCRSLCASCHATRHS